MEVAKEWSDNITTSNNGSCHVDSLWLAQIRSIKLILLNAVNQSIASIGDPSYECKILLRNVDEGVRQSLVRGVFDDGVRQRLVNGVSGRGELWSSSESAALPTVDTARNE